MRRVYLDNNATTPCCPRFWRRCGRISARVSATPRPSIIMDRRPGRRSSARANRSRVCSAAVRRRSCSPAVARRADNLAIFGMVEAGDHVITSTIEHHAVLNSCKQLEARDAKSHSSGRWTRPGRSRGRAARAAAEYQADHHHDGQQRNRRAAAGRGDWQRSAAEADVYFHTDAVQAAGKVPIDVKRSAAICCRSPATRCMRRKAWARFMSAREPL